MFKFLSQNYTFKILLVQLLCLSSAFAINDIPQTNISFQDFKGYNHPRFNKFKAYTAPKIAEFANQYLASFAQKTRAIFYPFGGPDIIYPLSLFPDANTYLLIGLEPTGKLKDEIPIPKDLNLQLDSLLRRSFFVTSDMARQVPKNQGVLPLFLAQISLMGGEVSNINITNESFGNLLEITFYHNQKTKKLFYVQSNVVNENLDDKFIDFIKENKLFDACLLKSSSYAFHQICFTKLRDFVTNNAQLILQDDTGVPFNILSKENFNISLFGKYQKPYGAEWTNYAQKDLRELYNETQNIPSLPFCYGYGCGRILASLILAVKQEKASLN